MAGLDESKIRQAAADLAAAWQDRANQLLTREEKGIQEQMLKLLTHPNDKVVLTKMIDQCFRSHDNDRVADQVNHILRDFGVPGFFFPGGKTAHPDVHGPGPALDARERAADGQADASILVTGHHCR